MDRKSTGFFLPTVALSTLLAAGSPLSVSHAASLSNGEESEARVTTAARELAASGLAVLPRLYQVLSASSPEAPDAALGIEEERTILYALSLMDPEQVLAYLDRELTGTRTIGRRRAAVHFLGAAGRATDILQLTSLIMVGDEVEIDGSVARAARLAVAQILRRDPVAFGVLEASFVVFDAKELELMVDAIGQAGDPRGLPFLCQVAAAFEDLRPAVIRQVPALGAGTKDALRVEMRAYARPLIRSTDPAISVVAIRAAAKLSDDEAIPTLIELLASENEELRVASTAALRSMTGLDMSSIEGWSRWYESERAWILTERAAAFQRLSSMDHREVREALAAIAPHPLVREEYVAALGDLLRTRPANIRVLICSALRQSGAREAIPQLITALGCTDSNLVQEAAWAALKSLTGRELPPQVEPWKALALELGFEI